MNFNFQTMFSFITPVNSILFLSTIRIILRCFFLLAFLIILILVDTLAVFSKHASNSPEGQHDTSMCTCSPELDDI